MRNRLRIDPMQPDDLAEIEAMAQALYAEDNPGEPMHVDKIRRTAAVLAAKPDKGRILVVRQAKAVVGYAILIDFWSNEYGGDLLSIDELYVRAPWRGRGIGSALIEHLAANLPAQTVGLQLEVSPANPRAAAFYRRLGFAPMRNQAMLRRR